MVNFTSASSYLYDKKNSWSHITLEPTWPWTQPCLGFHLTLRWSLPWHYLPWHEPYLGGNAGQLVAWHDGPLGGKATGGHEPLGQVHIRVADSTVHWGIVSITFQSYCPSAGKIHPYKFILHASMYCIHISNPICRLYGKFTRFHKKIRKMVSWRKSGQAHFNCDF